LRTDLWLQAYWALFASQVSQTKGLTWLQNPNLPILEVNAGYGHDWQLLKTDAKKISRPALLVSNQIPEPSQVLYQGMILEWQGQSSLSSVMIEQVAWTQANTLAQVWCEQCKARSWHGLVSLEIARVMQQTPELCAYLAYDGQTPIGMLLVMPKSGWWHNGTPAQWFSSQVQGAVGAWWAGTFEIAQALFTRASTDFQGLEVSVPIGFIDAKIITQYTIVGFDELLT
jgi:hypothetical protein